MSKQTIREYPDIYHYPSPVSNLKSKKECKHPRVARHPTGFCNQCQKYVGKWNSKPDKKVDWSKENLEREIIRILTNFSNRNVSELSFNIAVEDIKTLLQKTREESFNKGWEVAIKQKNLIIGILMKDLTKEREKIIEILKKQSIKCSGSCGAGCELLVEKLIISLQKL